MSAALSTMEIVVKSLFYFFVQDFSIMFFTYLYSSMVSSSFTLNVTVRLAILIKRELFARRDGKTTYEEKD
jgi:hypothetical protein